MKKFFTKSVLAHILIGILLIAGMALVEFLNGRLLICKCGYVLAWYNNTNGPGSSQHLSDWYTFSHIIHGMLFYGFLWLVARRLPIRTRLILAIIIEAGWEMLENSSFIIDRYRTATFALDYYGDSIINSVFDVLFMSLGFLLTIRIPTWLTIVLIIAMELFTVYMVRDNLTLNVIMLIHPIEAIKVWQAALPVTF
jgi:hypothetical protein